MTINAGALMTIDLEDGLKLYKTHQDAAMQALGQKGFPSPAIPVIQTAAGPVYFRGEIPTDLTQITDDQLGTFMSAMSGWITYVDTELAKADSSKTGAEVELELVEARLRIVYRIDEDGKKRSNPERDDYVRVDRRYVEAKSQVLYWETIYRYVKAIYAGAHKNWESISRRITQRGQELERDRRGGSVGSAPLPAGPLFGRGGRP